MGFHQYLLGPQKIETPQQERKVLLGAYLILLYLIIDFILFFVNLIDPRGIPWALVSGVVVSIVSLILLRKGHTNLAIFFYLLRANSIVFFFARQEEIDTGTFIYFLSYGITPLAFYGYHERWKGIAYSLVTFVLFLIANFQAKNFRPDHPHFNFIINYTFVLITLSFIILFFDRINKLALLKINNQNKELIKANEELDRFVYSVSHDLRSPLASILGLVNIYDLTNDETERNNILKMIEGRTLKLDEFIRKILDYSRNSRREIIRVPVNLKQALKDVLDYLKFLPGFESAKIRINIPDNEIAITDEERLKIILTNLIGNAIKYIDKKKETQAVEIFSVRDNSNLVITIKDNGIGIALEHQPRIFEMFYRATQTSDGSGIGLYIAKECISKLGGEILFQSVESEGSTFRIIIPIEP